jgi:hypothetical protein
MLGYTLFSFIHKVDLHFCRELEEMAGEKNPNENDVERVRLHLVISLSGRMF